MHQDNWVKVWVLWCKLYMGRRTCFWQTWIRTTTQTSSSWTYFWQIVDQGQEDNRQIHPWLQTWHHYESGCHFISLGRKEPWTLLQHQCRGLQECVWFGSRTQTSNVRIYSIGFPPVLLLPLAPALLKWTLPMSQSRNPLLCTDALKPSQNY